MAGMYKFTDFNDIGPYKQFFQNKIVVIFLIHWFKHNVMGAQKKCLIEMVLLSTYNIYFGGEIRKKIKSHRST